MSSGYFEIDNKYAIGKAFRIKKCSKFVRNFGNRMEEMLIIVCYIDGNSVANELIASASTSCNINK